MQFSGLYYTPIMIIKDDSSIINKLEALLIDDAGVIIYDHHSTGHRTETIRLYYGNTNGAEKEIS